MRAMRWQKLWPCVCAIISTGKTQEHGSKHSYHAIFLAHMISLIPNTHIFCLQLCTRFIKAKTQGTPNVEIWGDGTARREFMYAPDLADAVLRAANDITTCPEVTNIGLGHDFTINEYYKEVADVIGWTGKFTHDLKRPVGMKQKLCDTSRAIEWGWRAPTSLRTGIEKTYEFYCERYL